MDSDLYISFILACIVLGLIPGPNVALIVANSLSHGARYGLYSMAGCASAMVPQLLAVSFGLSAVLVFMSEYFEVIRWIGVMYLVYLAFRQWSIREEALDVVAMGEEDRGLRSVYWSGFWVSATNPKTLLFFGAFMPQFVSAQAPVLPQMLLLSVTLIVVIALVDSGWALAAGSARRVLGRLFALRHRFSSGLFLCSAIGLVFARKS